MRKTIVVLAMLALVVPVLAGTLVTPDVVRGQQMSNHNASDRGVPVYDNTTGAVSLAFAGPDGAIIGDDLLLTQAGVLDSIDFSIYNSSNSDAGLSSMNLDISFYDVSGAVNVYVGSITMFIDMFEVLGGDLMPGYFTTLTASGLGGLGINLPQYVGAFQRAYSFGTTGSAVAIGQAGGALPTLGSSGNVFWYDDLSATPPGTDSGWFWFGSTKNANFIYGVSITPEPASFALLAVGALALIRRR